MRLFAAILLATLCSATPASELVTETQFLSVFDSDHPAWMVREAGIGLAQADIRKAAALENPELGLVREAPDGTEQIDLLLSWQLPSSSRGLELDAARHGESAARALGANDLLELRFELREAFAQWALSRRRADRLAALVNGLHDLAERQSHRAEQGESSDLEAWRLQLASVEVRSWLALAESEAQAARAVALGWRPDLPRTSIPVMPLLPPDQEDDWPRHPLMDHLEESLIEAELAERAASRFAQLPSLSAGWQRQSIDDLVIDGLILGLSWPLPALHRKQDERLRKHVEAQTLRARIDIKRERLVAQRESAITVYRRLREAAMETSRDISRSERVSRAALAAFDHGECTLTDLLDTLRSVAQVELAATDLHEAALAAHRELERAAGQPLELLPPSNGEQK